MPTYKLYYFPSRGGAEVSRMIFKQAGVEFEDIRKSGEDWAAFKPNTPYGFVPVLEVDGKMLAGAHGIQRYLAEEFGLAGSNAWENAEIDSIVDVLKDLSLELVKVFFEKDEKRKAEASEKLKNEVLPKYLGILEKLAANSSSWLYGSKVTYADFALYNVMGWVKMAPGSEEVIAAFPNIAKNMAAVEALPNIAKWLKERPVTEY